MLKAILILIVFVTTSCWNNSSLIKEQTQQLTNKIQEKSDNQYQQKTEPQLTLTMERFTWTRTLDYKVEIQPDGKVDFTKTNGRFLSSKIIRKVKSKLEKEKIKKLLIEIETSDFFSLDSAYGYRFKNCPLAMSDNDSVKIYVKLNGKEKMIDHDLGCLDMSLAELKKNINRNDRIFPQELYKLENKIDEIAETKRWIGEKE